jgi:hypothetical protein
MTMRFEVHNITQLPIRIPVVLRQKTDFCIVQPGKNLVEADLIPNADQLTGLVISSPHSTSNGGTLKITAPTVADPTLGNKGAQVKTGTLVTTSSNTTNRQPQVVVSATTEKGN